MAKTDPSPPAGDTPPAADSPPPAASPPAPPADTSSTRGKGTYYQRTGASPAAVAVLVSNIRRGKDTEGNPRDVADLTLPGAEEPFCTACPVTDASNPAEGHWLPA